MECRVRILHYGPNFPGKDVVFIGQAITEEGNRDCAVSVEYTIEKVSLEIQTKDASSVYKISKGRMQPVISKFEVFSKNRVYTDTDIISQILKNSQRGVNPDICRIYNIPLIELVSGRIMESSEFDACMRLYGSTSLSMQSYLEQESIERIRELRTSEADKRKALREIASIPNADFELHELDKTLESIFDEILLGKKRDS